MERIKVVVVDDSVETRNNIKQLLSFDKRLEVIGEAENGKEAISIARESGPDVILMDINMPVVDGIRATEEISLSVPQTKVIVMSVQGGTEYVREAMKAGAWGFLCKPFNGDELSAAIMNAYDRNRSTGENSCT